MSEPNAASTDLTSAEVSALRYLTQWDGLRRLVGGHPFAFRHEDHRWMLPLTFLAQQRGRLPTPCNLVLFDAHHDCKPPRNPEVLAEMRRAGLTLAGLIELCDSSDLSALDDDWIRAGMELGILDHVAVFGVEQQAGLDALGGYEDHLGAPHLTLFPGLPRGELQFKGALSDVTSREEHEALWALLGWRPGRGFDFRDVPPFALDFDLDCFVVRWNDYEFPWLDEVWEKEFLEPSTYDTTAGWSGREVVRALSGRAGLLTVVREPTYCGGSAKAEQIFRDLNRHVFDDVLRVQPDGLDGADERASAPGRP